MYENQSSRFARFAWVLAVSLATTTATGVDNPPLEKVLLPIAFDGEISGAFGSRWATRVAVTNRSTTEVAIDGIIVPGCNFDPCVRPTPRIQPGATIYPKLSLGEAGVPAAFIYVEEGRTDAAVVQLRAQDVSRQALTWGTEIPVIHQSDAFTDALTLTDIPIDSRFRLLLRVYDLDSAPTSSVRVRIYRVDPAVWNPDVATADALAVEFPLALTVPSGSTDVPGYAQFDLGSIQELNGLERVRVEVAPTSPQLRFWAFVSVTNNETQHFTTITPE